jgi:hypothetical protein
LKIYNDLERERERESKHCYLKKYVDDDDDNNNNNNVLISRLLQNVLLEEFSVDKCYTNS